MADQNLDIKIRTSADTSGATAAAASLKGVEAASTGTTTASRRLYDATQKQATGQKQASEQTLKGAEAFEKLRNAASGGASGILQIIPALKGLAAAFAANPVTAGIAAFLLLKDYASAAGSALGDLIVSGRNVADSLKTVNTNSAITAANLAEIEAAGETALKQIATDAKTAADDIDRFTKGIDEAAARLDKLADAATAAKLAELDLAEAQALSNAGSETERETIRQNYGDQRTAVRRDAAAATQDRTTRFENERAAGAQSTISAATGRIDSAQAAANVAAKVLADQLAKNKGLNAATPEGQEGLRLAAVARAEAATKASELDAAKKANAPIIEQAQTQAQLAKTNLQVLASQTKTTSAKEQAAALTDSPQRAARLQAAREADANAATLTGIGNTAGRFAAGATGIASGAKASGDTGLQSAAKALNDAATAAETDGTTLEEARALVEAANTLGAEMKKRGQESAALAALLKSATEALKGLRN